MNKHSTPLTKPTMQVARQRLADLCPFASANGSDYAISSNEGWDD